MSADVYAVVAEAIRTATPCDDHGIDCWCAGSRAAVDALAGMGDVSDEQIVEAIRDVEWDWEHSAPDERAPHVAAAVRALIAQARATDQARIAMLEGRIGAAHGSRAGQLIGLRLRAEAAEATVERVRALCEPRDLPRTNDLGVLAFDDGQRVLADRIRAALSGEGA